MNSKIYRLFSVGIILSAIFLCSKIYAAQSFEIAGDFWNQANDWYSKGVQEYSEKENGGNIGNLAETNSTVGRIIGEFERMINIIGTTVIVSVTTFLGIKYMYGSAEAKSSVKDNLLTLLVACIFFFGWNAIWNILFNSGTGGLILNEGGYENVVGNIFKVISLAANILAVGGVIFMGIKYIFAGATGKAELKGKSGIFIVGVILAFCSVGVLNYISSVVNQVLGQ